MVKKTLIMSFALMSSIAVYAESTVKFQDFSIDQTVVAKVQKSLDTTVLDNIRQLAKSGMKPEEIAQVIEVELGLDKSAVQCGRPDNEANEVAGVLIATGLTFGVVAVLIALAADRPVRPIGYTPPARRDSSVVINRPLVPAPVIPRPTVPRYTPYVAPAVSRPAAPRYVQPARKPLFVRRDAASSSRRSASTASTASSDSRGARSRDSSAAPKRGNKKASRRR